MDFQMVKIDQPQYIYLKDYAPIFHKNLNMTVDEAIAAIENGTAVFANIKTSRQCWDLTPPLMANRGGITPRTVSAQQTILSSL